MDNKWRSRRWWAVLWAMAYISIMSFVLIFTEYEGGWVTGTLALIGGIIVSWMTVSSIKKKAGE